MKRIRRTVLDQVRFWAVFGVAVGIGLVVAVSCNPVIMVAPPGSSIVFVGANPTIISAHTGVAEISVLIMEGTGVPVSDGTVVQFFTDLGRIEEQGKTNDGVARVKLVADSRSGVAHIRVFSGGGAAPPAPTSSTASPAPTTSGSPTTAPTSGGGGTNSGNVDVTIGNLNAVRLFLQAVPNRITNSRSSQIIATAVDGAGNPAPNVPIYFNVQGNPGNERMDSGGNPVFTDNNGRANDVLRTIAINDGNAYQVTVRARTVGAGGAVLSEEIVVTIN
jgi:hypothetical protein